MIRTIVVFLLHLRHTRAQRALQIANHVHPTPTTLLLSDDSWTPPPHARRGIVAPQLKRQRVPAREAPKFGEGVHEPSPSGIESRASETEGAKDTGFVR